MLYFINATANVTEIIQYISTQIFLLLKPPKPVLIMDIIMLYQEDNTVILIISNVCSALIQLVIKVMWILCQNCQDSGVKISFIYINENNWQPIT